MPDIRPPDETLALAVVITGVLILDGSAALQVVWLVAIAVASALGVLRRSASGGSEPSQNGAPPDGGTPV